MESLLPNFGGRSLTGTSRNTTAQTGAALSRARQGTGPPANVRGLARQFGFSATFGKDSSR